MRSVSSNRWWPVVADALSDFVTRMELLPPLWAYLTILVIAYGENVVPPIPGDMVVVFGGYLVGIGQLNFAMVVVLATVGGAAGFMTMYAIGYAVGDAVKHPKRFRWISTDQVEKAQQWLDRWGFGLIAANRFLSGLRSVISLTVGIARTNPSLTFLYSTLSALVWTTLITYGGYAVGENWQVIGVYLRDYGRVVLIVFGLAAVAQVMRWYLKRNGSSPPDADSGNFTGDGG